ncbi:MAG: high-potential iron-sulfur protein [Ectothiorhodospiraceae bacterium]|nr:high-potential iron-sulfur protein [Ectothiorhodospiraceae bacterium]MCH8502857.1 high-potential iron-sulfur protein [Ectothiorhodospiraceae bacterium]
MTDHSNDRSRRRFLKGTAAGLAALPVAGLSLSAPRFAQADDELERLSEDDPAAEAVAYVHDAADADDPAYEEGQICANCSLYTDEGGDWGRCSVFPGKLVAAEGWCNVWVPAS